MEPATNSPPTKWEMGTRDQALFASVTAVLEYLSWLGGEVENDFGDKVADIRVVSRILKTALAWIEQYEQTLAKAMLDGVGNNLA